MPYIKEEQTVQWQNITQKTKDWETQTSSIIKKNKQTIKQTIAKNQAKIREELEG